MPVLTAGTRRVLYIHVPKTGGSYVEALLRSYGTLSGVRFGDDFAGLPCSPQHLHGPLIEHMYSIDRWEAIHAFDYVFMTVRAPLPRLESEFRYRTSQTRSDRARAWLGVPVRFEPWALKAIEAFRRDPFVLDNHIRPQHEFSAFGAEVFRMEDGLSRIADVLDRVTGTRGERPEAPVNPTPASRNHRLALSEHARTLIDAFYAADYERFGYAQGDAG